MSCELRRGTTDVTDRSSELPVVGISTVYIENTSYDGTLAPLATAAKEEMERKGPVPAWGTLGPSVWLPTPPSHHSFQSLRMVTEYRQTFGPLYRVFCGDIPEI